MNYPLEWETDYCLSKIESELSRDAVIKAGLFGIPPSEPLTGDDAWEIRAAVNEINAQVKLLRESMKQYNAHPKKKSFVKKLLRK